MKKMVRCMMNLILAVGRSMKWIMTFHICLMPLQTIIEINYTYGSLTQPMAKEILLRVTIFLFLIEWMREGGVIKRKMKMTRRKQYIAKEMRAYILVSRVIDGETCLHDLGGIDDNYHLDIPFERLDDGYTTLC